jgi:hypothetical protein
MRPGTYTSFEASSFEVRRHAVGDERGVAAVASSASRASVMRPRTLPFTWTAISTSASTVSAGS